MTRIPSHKFALTKRQQECLDAIRVSIERHGYPPTVRELCDTLGIDSPNGIACHLDALQRKGWIKRDGETARGIRLVGWKVRLVEVG